MVRLNCLRVNQYTVHQTPYYNTTDFRLDYLQRILLTVYMQKDKSCHYNTLVTFLFSLFIVCCQTNLYLRTGVVDCTFNLFFLFPFSMLIFMQNAEFFLKNTDKNESSNIIWEEIGFAEILKNFKLELSIQKTRKQIL